MEFSKLKQGDEIFMFDTEKVEYKKGVVASTPTQPRMDPNVTSGLVVDVSVSVDGVKTTYVFLSNAEFATMKETVFATSISPVLDAIKATKVKNQDIVDRHDSAVANVGKCESLMLQLDPERKRAMEDDARWRKMESTLTSSLGEQKSLMLDLKSCMSQLTDAIVSLSKAQAAPAKKNTQQTLLS